MNKKKIRKAIARFFSWYGLIFCSLIVKFIPGRYIYSFAENIASLGYLFARKQRKIALNGLNTAFGKDKSQREIEQIAEDCFIFMAKSAIELLFLMARPQALRQAVKMVGRDNLDAAIAQGRGVILVSAHFGNFPLLLAKLSLEGYNTSGIMRPMRDSRVEAYFAGLRRQMNVMTIYSQPRDVCVNQTLRQLRGNGVVFIPIDQNFGTGGVFVNFFGRKAATATGPVVLAQRTKSALIPCFIIRQKDDTHKIVFEPALDLEEGANPQETVAINIQKLTAIIESYIRKHPAEWGWIHRRWKTEPK